MAGLTASGFERKTLPQILDSLRARAREEFGEGFNTGDDSVFLQIAGSIALEVDELWQGTQESYAAYTRSGAEGVHLDNYFNLQGVTRLDAEAASGFLLVETNNRLELTTLDSRRFSHNQTRFTNTEVGIGVTNTYAYRLPLSDLVTGQVYTATVVDDSGVLQTLTSTALNTEQEKRAYLGALRIFWEAHVADSVGKTSVTADTLLVGINPDSSYNILLNTHAFNLSPLVGLRYGRVAITAENTGFQPILPGSDFRITPNFPGFSSAFSYEDLNPGKDVESDAEFRLRGARELRSEAIGTEDAILQQLGQLGGVRSVRLYENVTNVPTPEVPQSWAYHVVVAGGVDSEIAQILHTYGPLNVAQYGTKLVNAINIAGGISPQRFSDATVRGIDIRISYRTSDGTALTPTEQATIISAYLILRDRLEIAADLQNILLQRPVLCSLPFDRLQLLTVETKPEGDPDTAYTEADLTAGPFDIFDWSDSNITFRQV